MLLILLGAVALVAIFVLLRLKENNMDVASIPSTPKPVGKYSKETPEVIIVGAGIAGNGLAKAFADQGRQVLLLERDLSEPDRIVGELLQPGGMQALKKLGMEKCVEGIDGIWEKGYAVYKNSTKEWVQLPFPINPATGSRYDGISFHHGRFIQNLRKVSLAEKNVNVVEATVTELLESGERITGVKYKLKGSQQYTEVTAPLTIVCDGCFSKFRKTLVKNVPKTVSHFVAVIMKDMEMTYEQHGNVFLVEPSPTLMYRIGTNEIRVLVDIPGESLPKDLAGHLLNVTAPQLPSPYREAFERAVKEGPIKSMPNQKLHPYAFIREGAIPIGDAYNMRHPLTGGGMTVALSDCVKLAETLKPVGDFSELVSVRKALDVFYKSRKPLASTINILAFALYSVFCGGSDDPAVVESVRTACFDYFKLGGQCVEGPMLLLSGVVESSNFLLYHYVRVALYGAYSFLFPPYPWRLWHAVKVLNAAYDIFAPLLTSERAGLVSRITQPPEYCRYNPSLHKATEAK